MIATIRVLLMTFQGQELWVQAQEWLYEHCHIEYKSFQQMSGHSQNHPS